MLRQDTARRRAERRRQQRRQEQDRQRQRQRTQPWLVIGALALLFVLVGGGVYFAFSQSNNSKDLRPGAAIDGVPCQAEMLHYHIHADLTLYRNGQPVVLPANVGIPINSRITQNGQHYCLYWLHTHESDHALGVVHIESPTKHSYTLGQFIDIWRYTTRWDAQSGPGYSVDASFVDALDKAPPSEIHCYVNGQPHGANYRDITLTAHTLITIEVGKPLEPPTMRFTFPKGE